MPKIVRAYGKSGPENAAALKYEEDIKHLHQVGDLLHRCITARAAREQRQVDSIGNRTARADAEDELDDRVRRLRKTVDDLVADAHKRLAEGDELRGEKHH